MKLELDVKIRFERKKLGWNFLFHFESEGWKHPLYRFNLLTELQLPPWQSGSFCGLAKSYDSYQWHEKPDMKVNNTNPLTLPKWGVTSAQNMSCLQGMAPAHIYLQ